MKRGRKQKFLYCLIGVFFMFFSWGGGCKYPGTGASGHLLSAENQMGYQVLKCPSQDCGKRVSGNLDLVCAQKATEAAAAKEESVQEERKLLASIIFCEAGNQPFSGQVAVGAVVLNRMDSSQFPDSMEEVIYQPGQFGPVATGWLDRVRRESGYTESAMQAAEAALNGENPIGECLYFDQGGHGMKIGAHYFH